MIVSSRIWLQSSARAILSFFVLNSDVTGYSCIVSFTLDTFDMPLVAVLHTVFNHLGTKYHFEDPSWLLSMHLGLGTPRRCTIEITMDR